MSNRNTNKNQPRNRKRKNGKQKSKARSPNTLARNPMPRVPKIQKAKVPLCSKVKKWSDLLKDPFNAPSGDVYCPITSNLIACPSTKVRNYGSSTLQGANNMIGWLYPTGRPSSVGPFLSNAIISSSDLDTSYPVQIGPMLANEAAPAAAAGFVARVEGPLLTPFTTSPSVYSGGYALNPLLWDGLDNPFTIPKSDGQMKFRNTAFGIRISFIGKLVDTEGYVEFFNPYHWSQIAANGEPVQIDSLRRDESYRRFYFSSNRTVTFVWSPNCESVQFASVVQADEISAKEVFSRMMFRIRGLNVEDIIEFEYIGFQEFTGFTTVATQTPSQNTVDSVHLGNAIPKLRGRMNTKGPEKTDIEKLVIKQKLKAHPITQAAMNTLPKQITKSSNIKTGVGKVFHKVASELGDVLSFGLAAAL